MPVAGMAELRARLGHYMALVGRGEEVLITERGTPVARIVPAPADPGHPARLRRMAAQGLIKLGKAWSPEELADFLASVPVCEVPEDTAQRLIDEERRED